MLTGELINAAPEGCREPARRFMYEDEKWFNEGRDLQDERLEVARLAAEDILAISQKKSRPGVSAEYVKTLDEAVADRERRRDTAIGIIMSREAAVAARADEFRVRAELVRVLSTHRANTMRNEGARLRYVAAPKVHGDLRALFEEVRALIDHNGEVLAKVRGAYPSAAELKEATAAEIDRLSREPQFRPSLAREAGDGRVREPFGLLSLVTPVRHEGGAVSGDHGAGLIVWLLKDELLERLFDIIDHADLRDAMSSDEQRREIERLEHERLKLERHEEAVIEAAALQGLHLPRRPDVNPLAVLRAEWVNK